MTPLKPNPFRNILILALVAALLFPAASTLAADATIKKAQAALLAKGIDPGPVDGLWGPRTQKAVIEFQKQEGLNESGELDEETANRLLTTAGAKEEPEPEPATPPASEAKADEPAEPSPEEPPAAGASADAGEKIADSPPAAPADEGADKPKDTPPPAPAPEAMQAASGDCPQKRKTPAAPSHIAGRDKTASASLENGKNIYHKTGKPLACKNCHGDQGDGQGKLGKALKPAPRNFTCQQTMADISPGQMFHIIKNGSAGTGMAPHAKTLKDSEIWDVVKYIRETFAPATAGKEKTSAAMPAEEPAQAASAPTPAVAAPGPAPSGNLPEVELPKSLKISDEYEETAVSGGGALHGVVHFAGAVPPSIMEDLSKGKNIEFCSTHPDANGSTRPRIKVAARDGRLKDAVVFIQNIDKGKAWPKQGANFDFQTCDIFPKVSVIRKTPRGAKTGLLTITNQDPDILHNPHGYSVVGANRKTLFNKPLPSKGDVADVTKSFKRFKPGKDKHFFLQCDQHNYMEADARVVWNPYYAISAGDGSFTLDDVPPGTYFVTAWHPYVGEASKQVTVSGGQALNLNFTLAAR